MILLPKQLHLPHPSFCPTKSHPTMNYNRSSSSSSSVSSGSMGLLGEVVESIKIDHTIKHIFTFNIGERWERPLRKNMDKILDLSLYYAESFRFIAVGIGSFFFLWGVSKVVEAGNRDDENDSKRRSSSKSSSAKKSSRKDSDNATVVTQSSRTTTGRSRRSSRRTDAAEQTRSSSPTPPTTIAFESIEETAEEDSTAR